MAKNKKSLWIEALLGLGLTVFVLGCYVLQSPIIEGLDLRAYDMRSSLRRSLDAAGKDVAIIAIDDDSLARLGRWPWSRGRLADMIDLLAAAKPKVIGLDILLSEPSENQGLTEIRALTEKFDSLLEARRMVQRRGVDFDIEFSSAAARLDADARLKDSISRAGNVVLPMFFSTGGAIGAKSEPVPLSISSSALTAQAAQGAAAVRTAGAMLEGMKATTPLAAFAKSAAGVGHVNIFPDFDGVLRRDYPVMKYGDQFFPSFALQLAMQYLGYRPGDVKVIPGRSVRMGANEVPVDENQSMMVSFAGPYQTFRYYSFHEVLNGKVEMSVFKDKIVILGPSAAGVATLDTIPIYHSQIPPIEFVANVIENIIYRNFLVRPDWAPKAELIAIALVGLFVMLILPRLRALSGMIVTLVLLAAILGEGTALFVRGQWLKAMYPGALLAAGYVVITVKRFLVTEKGKELIEASAIETNKMLGLSFQGQGMLDLAFDKFRLCPMDDQLKDLLYNLGLDFERKRQYNKSVAVYEHIALRDPRYKDIQEKIKVLKQAAEGAVFGGVGGGQKEGTVLIAGGASKPTLGRYEIEKELGRGAMGVVYLGKDPKINRKVAIKTMLLDEETDPGALKETKERFFREAESAGTLNHPNIVRIFDAGEEHDVCYIAMELLEGSDLTRHTKKGSLLPMDRVMEYAVQVADALDYAHQQGIVHRDIKPANIMLMKDGSVRVTDFGIARITASSKTATGTVMGTPSYMSPEQVAGRKVDGRSDLFSMGVALFELLTGEKPFKGGDGIGALLFQIANDPEPEPRDINPALPSCASNIIHKALKKKPEDRYQRGSQFAADLRACIEAMRHPGASPEPAAAAASNPPSVQTAPVLAAVETVVPKPVEAKTDPQIAAIPADQTARLPSAEEVAASIILSAPPPSSAEDGTIPAEAPPAAQPLGPAAASEKPAPTASTEETKGNTIRLVNPESS